MTKKLKLMADYECYPLWEIFEDSLENINPDTLELSRDLVESLEQWACEYDATLNSNDPLNSGFSSEEAESKFEAEGRKLFDRLRGQLRAEYVISYYSRKESKSYT